MNQTKDHTLNFLEHTRWCQRKTHFEQAVEPWMIHVMAKSVSSPTYPERRVGKIVPDAHKYGFSQKITLALPALKVEVRVDDRRGNSSSTIHSPTLHLWFTQPCIRHADMLWKWRHCVIPEALVCVELGCWMLVTKTYGRTFWWHWSHAKYPYHAMHGSLQSEQPTNPAPSKPGEGTSYMINSHCVSNQKTWDTVNCLFTTKSSQLWSEN